MLLSLLYNEKICLYCYVYSLLFPTHTHIALDHVRAEGCSLHGLAEECAKTGDMKYLLQVLQTLLKCQLVLFRNGIQINIGNGGLVVGHVMYIHDCSDLFWLPYFRWDNYVCM